MTPEDHSFLGLLLKTFAQVNLRYQEARPKAEGARQVIDQALKSLDK